jgi:hypothetical protein
MSPLRAILILSRLSGLPTIWSNCLAGWWLGGGGNHGDLPFLFAGATFIYLGGAFLNDAFDVEHDRMHRPGRPIPSGAIKLETAWRWGLGWLAAGALSLLALGNVSAVLGLALVVLVVLRSATHRVMGVSVVLSGLCRFLLYILGACVTFRGVTGWAIWCGLALAAYVTGLEFLARWRSEPERTPYWPAGLLAAPILLALILDVGPYRESALLLSAILALWVLRALRQTFWSLERNLQKTISSLMAGIVLVDWLATAKPPRELSFAFIGLLLVTVVLQRLTDEG